MKVIFARRVENLLTAKICVRKNIRMVGTNAMIADSSEIKFECAQCGQSIAVDISGAGVSTNCPTCDFPLVVPSLSSLHDRTYGENAPDSGGRPTYAGLSADEVQELRDELAEALRVAEESARTLATARKEAALLEQRATAAETHLAEARAMISNLHEQLSTAEETRAQWEQAFAQTAEQAHATETQMAARETELRAALAAAQSAGEASAAETAVLRSQFESLRTETLAAAATEQEKFAAVLRALDATQAERNELSTRGEALRMEIETLRYDLSEIHTGRELLALRDRFATLDTEHQRTSAAYARSFAEIQSLSAAGETLRMELAAALAHGAEADRRAEAASESALAHDNAVLRGIIERQNTIGEERYLELRRLRRARLMLRILYTLIVLGFLGLAALAIDYLPDVVKHFLHDWFGLQ